MYAIITDKKGRPIDDATPFPIKIVDANGQELELINGKLPVDANITIESVTLDDVIIKDGSGTENKMKVNADGSLLMQQTGSLLDLRGLAANKPTANAVAPGTTYWSVDSDPHANNVEVSDGTKWTVI